jgi:hypothetical protein
VRGGDEVATTSDGAAGQTEGQPLPSSDVAVLLIARFGDVARFRALLTTPDRGVGDYTFTPVP